MLYNAITEFYNYMTIIKQLANNLRFLASYILLEDNENVFDFNKTKNIIKKIVETELTTKVPKLLREKLYLYTDLMIDNLNYDTIRKLVILEKFPNTDLDTFDDIDIPFKKFYTESHYTFGQAIKIALLAYKKNDTIYRKFQDAEFLYNDNIIGKKGKIDMEHRVIKDVTTYLNVVQEKFHGESLIDWANIEFLKKMSSEKQSPLPLEFLASVTILNMSLEGYIKNNIKDLTIMPTTILQQTYINNKSNAISI